MLRSVRVYLVNTLKRNGFFWKILEFFQGLMYAANYLLYYKWKIIKQKASTREFNIEFVSYCNLRCSFCSLDHSKPKIRMTEEILERFLQNYISDKRFHSIEVIHLYNAGETLLHPNIEKLLFLFTKYRDIAKSKNIPFPKVSLLTNGTPLTEKKTIAIIESGAIDEMRFSMDGGSPERFEAIRIRAEWDKFHKNISFFHEEIKRKNSPIKTHIICVIDKDKPEDTSWMTSEFVAVLNMVNTYELRKPHDWAGEVDLDGNEPEKSKPHKIGCGMLMHQLVLLPNGDVTICCADLNSRGVIGNLKNADLFSIYNSPKRREWLKFMFQGKKHKIDLCKDCETY